MKTNEEKLQYLNEYLTSSYETLDEVNWNCISQFQKLSEEFRKEFNLEIP